jgi:type I restriction enzyme S subunit
MRWATRALGDCATLVNGRAYKQEELLDSGTPVLRIQNLNGGDRWYYSDLLLPREKYCEKGDLLFAWSASFGPYIWEGPRSIYHYHIWKVIPGEKLDKKFFYHLLAFLTARVRRESHGASMLHMTKARMEAMEIPLPPLEEQRRIAAILDKSAEISGANKQRQDLLKAFPLSVYRQMLGDPRLNPFQWPVFSLGEICLNEDARRVPVKSSDRKAMQGRFPYYGASGIIDHVDSYLFDGQRLLVGEDGANLLARSSPIAFIADGKYWVNNHAHVLGENGKAKLRFLEYYFALIDLKPFVTGSAQPKLTRSALDSLPVPLPPLELQERFESVLTAMDIRLAQAKISTKQALSLSNALRHMSFQGEAA